MYPLLHPDLLGSGIAWQAVQHIYFDLVDEKLREDFQLKPILVDAATTVKQLVTFAMKFASVGAESF
jgi:hypothetical protein